MNRQIKFRAWCPANNEMYLPNDGYEFWCDNNSIGFYPRYNTDELQDFNTIPAEHEKEIIVMQFTGLHDKNGKDAYHKDIVASGKKHYIIEWQDEEARFLLMPTGDNTGTWKFMDELNHMTIIGNVYENI